jgi:hypothetical protein
MIMERLNRFGMNELKRNTIIDNDTWLILEGNDNESSRFNAWYELHVSELNRQWLDRHPRIIFVPVIASHGIVQYDRYAGEEGVS